MKDKCSLVSEKTKQEQDTEICEIRQRWQWVESSIWTDKMLTALEKGVKGGKWFSLCDKIFDSANLFRVCAKNQRFKIHFKEFFVILITK